MGKKKQFAAVLLVAALVAAAFFLPEWLSVLGDRQLLDTPVIETQEGDQEGFAETFQLSVAEKLMLLRSGSLTAMELSREPVEGVALNIFSGDGGGLESEDKVYISGVAGAELLQEAPGSPEEALSQVWEERLENVRLEIRSLQAMGGLPALWREDSSLTYTGFGEMLYMDPGTRMNFLVYRMTISCEPYSMAVTVDVQSGRILSFDLRWSWKGGRPAWGVQGASNFGAVWRNYWGMDSVGGGWYSGYNRTILEQPAEQLNGGGDYDAHGQISFTYDGQTILIPLDLWSYNSRSSSLSWNI